MLSVCRRGTASICRVAQVASRSAVPVSRSSILASASFNASKPLVATRLFHVSPSMPYFEVDETKIDPKYDITPRENPNSEDQVITKFQDLADRGLVHPNIVDTITKDMGHQTMTDVQALTIDETLKGTDVYVIPRLREAGPVS